MTSARSATAALPASASPPSSATSAAARPEPPSVASTGSPHPRASARAMLPAPISPMVKAQASGLVEEALFDQPRALLRGDLDVARREHEHLVGDPLHAAVERVGQPAGEIDQALGQVGLDALEVEDHRHVVLEPVGDLLGVVERLGDDEVHAHVAVAAATTWHRLQRRRAGRWIVVGEDVVDLVAAPSARRQPPDARPLAIAILELDLGLGARVLLLEHVALLGQAEVHERAVPRITERHRRGVYAETPVFPARTPSAILRAWPTATSWAKSWSRAGSSPSRASTATDAAGPAPRTSAATRSAPSSRPSSSSISRASATTCPRHDPSSRSPA